MQSRRTQVLEIGIILEQRIAGITIPGRLFEPFECRFLFVHQGVRRTDVIRDMMRVDEMLLPARGFLDSYFRFIPFSLLGIDHREDAEQVSIVRLRESFQKIFEASRSFSGSLKVE